MLEKENLTPFQIQLLLYYLTAEPSKRTVTDSARSLNVSKWVVTRTLDTLEKLNIVERLENRKTVLTVPGVKLAEKYQKQRKVLEKYMQYQDIPPAQIKENALRALAARFSDEFMDRLAEQESRMHIKEIFAGRRDFHGGDICNYLSDGSYYFPFIIYREQIKNHNNLSMANRGFENPCEVIVKDHEGLVYLAAKTVSAQSMSSKIKWKDASRSCNTYMTENSVTAALTGVMYFSGNGTAVYLYGKRPGYPAAWKRMPENAMQCWGYAYAGEYSCFHHVHPLKQADSEEMKNFWSSFATMLVYQS